MFVFFLTRGPRSVTNLANVLRRNKSTSQLVLAGNALGRKGWAALAAGLADNRALVSLDVAECELDGVSLDVLCRALADGAIESVSMRGTALGNAGAAALCGQLLAHSRSLLRLDVADTHWLAKDVMQLAEALSAPRLALTSLDLTRAHLAAVRSLRRGESRPEPRDDAGRLWLSGRRVGGQSIAARADARRQRVARRRRGAAGRGPTAQQVRRRVGVLTHSVC